MALVRVMHTLFDDIGVVFDQFDRARAEATAIQQLKDCISDILGRMPFGMYEASRVQGDHGPYEILIVSPTAIDNITQQRIVLTSGRINLRFGTSFKIRFAGSRSGAPDFNAL